MADSFGYIRDQRSGTRVVRPVLPADTGGDVSDLQEIVVDALLRIEKKIDFLSNQISAARDLKPGEVAGSNSEFEPSPSPEQQPPADTDTGGERYSLTTEQRNELQNLLLSVDEEEETDSTDQMEADDAGHQ
jgi:hypothetical protein